MFTHVHGSLSKIYIKIFTVLQNSSLCHFFSISISKDFEMTQIYDKIKTLVTYRMNHHRLSLYEVFFPWVWWNFPACKCNSLQEENFFLRFHCSTDFMWNYENFQIFSKLFQNFNFLVNFHNLYFSRIPELSFVFPKITQKALSLVLFLTPRIKDFHHAIKTKGMGMNENWERLKWEVSRSFVLRISFHHTQHVIVETVIKIFLNSDKCLFLIKIWLNFFLKKIKKRY